MCVCVCVGSLYLSAQNSVRLSVSDSAEPAVHAVIDGVHVKNVALLYILSIARILTLHVFFSWMCECSSSSLLR